MIVPDAVAVVELDGDGPTPPFGDPARFASILDDTEPQQRPFDGQSAFRLGKDSRNGPRSGTRDDRSSFHRRYPGCAGKPEPVLALAVCVIEVVVRLNRRPIVFRISVLSGTGTIGVAERQSSVPRRFQPGREAHSERRPTFGRRSIPVVVRLNFRPRVFQRCRHIERMFDNDEGLPSPGRRSFRRSFSSVDRRSDPKTSPPRDPPSAPRKHVDPPRRTCCLPC